MKISTKRLLSMLLILSLFAALLSAGVFAVDVPEISCELGASLDYTIPQEGGNSATGFEVVSGSLPSGVSVKLEDGAVKLVGTPGASGDYSYRLKITNASGTAEYSLLRFTSIGMMLCIRVRLGFETRKSTSILSRADSWHCI